MALKSTGRAYWEGDLFTGHGTATVDSGAVGPMQVDWNARAEEHGGKTSPEELIAAAHATCYSMAFSNMLAKNETPATSIDTSATITFVPGTGITTSELVVTAVVPGIDEEKFQELAAAAKDGCPVSKALQGNVELSLEATLAGV